MHIAFDKAVFHGNVAFLVVVLSSEKWYSSFWKRFYFSIKRRVILKIIGAEEEPKFFLLAFNDT